MNYFVNTSRVLASQQLRMYSVQKIWLSQYQPGVPENINLDEYASLVDLFNDSCKKFRTNSAFSNYGSTLTFADIDKLSTEFAGFLQQSGLVRGDRVAVMMPNILQYPVVLFGILRAGMVVVNTNPLYTAEEVAHQLNDSGAKAIVILANFCRTLEKALPHITLQHIIVTELGDLFSPLKRYVASFIVRHIKKMIPTYQIPQAISFRHCFKQKFTKYFTPPKIEQQDIAFLQYTGGTTGISKGAILTHQNMLSNLLQAHAWMSPMQISDKDIVVTALPLYHIFSLTANCLTFIKSGCKNILITNPRDISHFVKTIKKSHFSIFTGVNTLFNGLLHHPQFKEIDFSSVKIILSGGMALQKIIAQQWFDASHTHILEAYGLTETSPAVTINPLYIETYTGSIGLPLPSTEISIRDEQGKEVKIGEKGELCVKGPQVMRGYWQRADETALVFTTDGYLKTGDIGYMDLKGFIYLVDRKKDMIIVSGFNVYPNEVEQVIAMHPGVLEVGVVGVPHEISGEIVKACIVKSDPALTKEDIIEFCRQHLTAYKIPKEVAFYQELPKSNVGKILRRQLS